MPDAPDITEFMDEALRKPSPYPLEPVVVDGVLWIVPCDPFPGEPREE